MIRQLSRSRSRRFSTALASIFALIASAMPVGSALAQSAGVFLTASKQIWSGNLQEGGTVTYILLIANQGMSNQADNPGHEFTDVLPSQLTLLNAGASAGTIASDVPNNTVTWDGAIAAGTSVAITISAAIKTGTAGQTVTNQGAIVYDADSNGTNESSGLTVGPGGGPTVFVVQPGTPNVSAAKQIVGGNRTAGGTVVYAVTLTNSGTGDQANNAGPEFIDTLPAGLTLGTPTATSGTVSANSNQVSWDGSIPTGTSVTITIPATIALAASGTIVNQGTVMFDADANGTNETTILTDDPSLQGAADPTAFVVLAVPPPPITPAPALNILALLLLGALVALTAVLALRRADQFGLRRMSTGRR